MSHNEVTNMDDWYKTLGEHNPLPNEEKRNNYVQMLARQRWGVKDEFNEAFHNAVEDGYLTVDGEVTPLGSDFLMKHDARNRERQQQIAREKRAQKNEKREPARKPHEKLIDIFMTHGFSLSKDSFAIEVDDRMINSATKNYRITFYAKQTGSGSRPIVGMFRGTLAQILGVIDEQVVVLHESMNGLPQRRRKKVSREREIPVDAAID